MIVQGDCLEVLKSMESNSIDAIVTDPPYGLAFMGKRWDYDVPSVAIWQECLRVLKPGGHLLAFGGTRTFHRTVVNIEDAGFEVRDMIAWIHGQGFPKSLDVSKAIDKEAGAEREVIGSKLGIPGYSLSENKDDRTAYGAFTDATKECAITAPATEAAKQWAGWGTALKPAIEPICMARKPISEKTVARNVLKHGCGGLNIDGCRIDTGGETVWKVPETEKQSDSLMVFKSKPGAGSDSMFKNKGGREGSPLGRFPANLILDEEAAAMLDEQSGILSKQGSPKKRDTGDKSAFGGGTPSSYFGDSGGASRFFYCAKPSGRERGDFNTHPTVKAVELMAYLCRLITPPNGLILDPFSGSGSTGVAAIKEGFSFIGIERESEYVSIAMKRMSLALGEADPLSFL